LSIDAEFLEDSCSCIDALNQPHESYIRIPKGFRRKLVQEWLESVLRTVPVPDENYVLKVNEIHLHQDHEVPVAAFATGCFGFDVAASLPFGTPLRPSTSVGRINIHEHRKVSPGATETIMKPRQHPFAMTLRLQNEMADEIENVAYTLNLTRAAFVRRSIRRAIEHAHQHELPLLKNKQVLEAIRP
jgi:predicted DNA-binding protein